LHVNKADAAVAAATAGHGITRVYSHMIAAEIASRALEFVLEDYEPPPIPVHIVHKEAGQTSARVRAVVDHLVENLRSHPALS
jgi:DNA-binding transcriptional LysR family regulator